MWCCPWRHIFANIRRAGFTLSRALFGKNVGPVTWGGRLYFSWKKLATFFGHHCRFSLVHSGVADNFRHAKNLPLFCGAPFCRAPVRPKMLSVTKSAAEYTPS